MPESFDAELLNVRALRAQATGRCVDGAPQLTGTSSVAGISVLGKELPVDRAISQTVNLVDSSDIDPSNLSPSQLGLPGVDTRPVRADVPRRAADDHVPATARSCASTPGRKIEAGGKLTQHALDLTLTVGGQNVVDLTAGEATVGSAQVNCGGVADLALSAHRGGSC